MCDYDLYLTLLGGHPTETLNDQYEQKEFIFLCAKELGTVSIAHWPCLLVKIEVPISSNFMVGIIC